MCLYPRLILNKKYVPNKKNGGQPPPVLDNRTRWVPVGCQNCIECRSQKAREWQIRLQEDLKHNSNAKMVTLTFSDQAIKELSEGIETKGYELDNQIATKAVRKFVERWRKKYKKSIRHWLVTELGHNGTENIHMHGIIWTAESMEEVEKIWKYGYVWKGNVENGEIKNYVNNQTVNYIIKYVTKVDEKHKLYKSKILTSPGIGRGYEKTVEAKTNKFDYEKTRETYRTESGNKMSLPIYYRNKIYKENEREELWLEKLDKQERYVLGVKIDISNGLEQYYKALKEARKHNKEMGYGNNLIDKEREEYEYRQRVIMQETRVKRATASKQEPAAPNDAGGGGVSMT